ncbi:MAG TPA: hypothetical protein VNV86_17835 [Candidatus Acidoferrum sp.]|nr:hypothetical protein [Candidatus Acidoferrum sp.]
MSPIPLFTGVLATLLASLQMLCWIAIGSIFVPETVEEEAGAPAMVLIGSAITTAIYAVFASRGELPAGFGLNLLLCVGALAWRRTRVFRCVQWIAGSLAEIWKGRRWTGVTCACVLGVYWIVAIGPPRDADVMRYHLAHIRQILAEGSWLPIADYHYALPFGWSMNYLPFERLNLPQAAHLVNLAVWIVSMAVLASMVRRFYSKAAVVMVFALFVAAPQIMKAATSAHADMYIAFSVLAISVIAMRLAQRGSAELSLLGFVAWIAANTRYQALGIGLAVSVIVGIAVLRRRVSWSGLSAYVLGTSAALLLSAPFYWFNWRAFHNPVWPIAVPLFNGAGHYADRVAAFYTASLTGHLSAASVAMGIFNLVRRPDVFPLPLLLVTLPIVYLVWKPLGVRYLVGILSTFFVLWALSQPVLFYRYSIMLTPMVVLGWAAVLYTWRPEWFLNRALQAALVLVAVGGVAFELTYSRHFVQYAVTGDGAAFHRFTWFYQPFQWANRETTADSKFLVMVTSGGTYYLHRDYRRADPWASGVIDWPAISTPRELDRVLAQNGYRYLIYEDKDWTHELGGKDMSAVMKSAIEAGTLREVAAFREPLSSIGILSELGLRPQTTMTQVRILQRSVAQTRTATVGAGGSL